MRFVVGVDLGRVKDPTGIVAVEDTGATLDVVLAEQLRPEREDMADLIPRLLEVVGHPRLRGETAVAVDVNGVGRAWLRLAVGTRLAAVAPLYAVVPVANTRPPGQRRGLIYAPTGQLAGCLARVLAERRLRVAEGLAAGSLLRRELERFRAKRRADGFVYFEGARGEHDDVAFAAMLAVWIHEDRRQRGRLGFASYARQEVA